MNLRIHIWKWSTKPTPTDFLEGSVLLVPLQPIKFLKGIFFYCFFLFWIPILLIINSVFLPILAISR
jgi:hypothetical protein